MLFSFGILIILLISLIGARHIIAAHLQGIAWLLTRHSKAGLIIYSLLFLPGIVIHELSHFFMAGVLGVRTGEITIFPSGPTESGQERLGSVQVDKTDIIRSSLIGIAPLLIGCLGVIAITKWQFPQLLYSFMAAQGTLNQLLIEGQKIVASPMNLVWIYLIFAIANTMFVSEADRRSWPAMVILLIIIGAIVVWAGLSYSLLVVISHPLGNGINILNAAFVVTLIIDVLVLSLLLVLEYLISLLLRQKVHYHPGI